MSLSAVGRLGGVALITGAASGIGRACAQRLAREGCQLVLTDINSKGLDATAKELSIDPSKCIKAVVDMTEEQAVEELFKSIPKKLGRLDYAINAAGIYAQHESLDKQPISDVDKILNVNLRAQIISNKFQVQAMLLDKEPIPSRLAQASYISEEEKGRRIANSAAFKGAIVNFSSVAGYRSLTGISPAYTISKHAIRGLTRTMATSFGPLGIRTNALAPGVILTPMVLEGLPGFEGFLPAIPLGRYGQPEDIADLVTFLCSEESSYINGETVAIDGGLLAG